MTISENSSTRLEQGLAANPQLVSRLSPDIHSPSQEFESLFSQVDQYGVQYSNADPVLPSIELAKPAPVDLDQEKDQHPAAAMDGRMDIMEILRQKRAEATARLTQGSTASALPQTPLTPSLPIIISQDLSSAPAPAPTPTPLLALSKPADHYSIPEYDELVEEENREENGNENESDRMILKEPQVHSLGPDEYIVPLPLVGHVRSVIVTDLKNNKPKIRKFVKEPKEADPALVKDMKCLVDRVKLCCCHPWLIEEESATQEGMSDDQVAKYSLNTSTKSMFLIKLLTILRSTSKHIAVLVRPGRTMQIVETILRYEKLAFDRLDSQESISQGTSSLKITLLPTNLDFTDIVAEPADLVIAFDSSLARHRSLGTLRAKEAAPLIHLVASSSIEHLELCIDNRRNNLKRLADLVFLTKQVDELSGILPAGYPSPDDAAKLVAEFIETPAKPWQLPELPFIEELVGLEYESSSEGSPEKELQGSGLTRQSHNMSPVVPSPKLGIKRPLTVKCGSDPSKRQKINGEHSMYGRIPGPDLNLTEDSNTSDGEGFWGQRAEQLEVALRDAKAANEELVRRNRELELHLADYERSIERIRPKYQEALNDRGEAAYNEKFAIEEKTRALQTVQKLQGELAALREPKAKANADLAQANTAMLDSTVPGMAEKQKIKDDLASAEREKNSLQKRLDNMQRTLSYVQDSYQTASAAAANAANEVLELQEENTKLKQKASDNAVKIHEINRAGQMQQYIERIDELMAQKVGVEQQLERKSEELKSMLNGRRPMRGTSTPRSPRLNTMSPRSRVLSFESRGNSPVPGDGFGRSGGTSQSQALTSLLSYNAHGRLNGHLQ
ncbi:hypothetical protein BJ878DRAFT_104863 [Calycina marina]|uniref:Uncharacterized protein n=1 Tax=Calycina marina TaxID=1763456 RepID=A0A9P7Z1M3_9HELO|nr:hypothetical protein BJ878DRAFT_104863 [Calycina marina]